MFGNPNFIVIHSENRRLQSVFGNAQVNPSVPSMLYSGAQAKITGCLINVRYMQDWRTRKYASGT